VPGIPKIGPKTAEKILENIEPTDMPTVVLKNYIEKFGLLKGITIFEETFNLLYILQSAEDVLQSTGIELEKLEIFNVNNLNNLDDDKS
jgi:5'-3' exonuclease